jgi:hypothetical protein
VLGSGGPELQDKRASSSYLVWQDGQARALVDAGGGSALRFGESGAQMSQLDVILFTHFHVDHSADFPALIFSSWFEERDRPLPVYGPAGNSEFLSTVDFVHALFNSRNGIYRYLSVLLVPQEEGGYELQPHNVAGDRCKAYSKSEKTFRAPLPLQTISIASRYPKVVKLSTRFDLFYLCYSRARPHPAGFGSRINGTRQEPSRRYR